MPFDNRDIERKLAKKFGFRESGHHSKKHRWYEFQLAGLPPIRTQFSHASGQVSKGLEGMIARQLRVKKAFFVEMITCTKGADDYAHILRTDPSPDFSVRL